MPALPQSHSFNETQQRILAAAITCVKQWGVEKTSLNDIAKQAGVTRPTVYRYFASRNEVLTTALMQSAYALGERIMAHMGGMADPVERYVETIVFAIEQIPNEPYLSIVMGSDFMSYVAADALSNQEGWALCLALMRLILDGIDLADDALQDITEVTIRLVLSLLTTTGPRKRSPDELRLLLHRCLAPMLERHRAQA